jgi:hypothetical protein
MTISNFMKTLHVSINFGQNKKICFNIEWEIVQNVEKVIWCYCPFKVCPYSKIFILCCTVDYIIVVLTVNVDLNN